MRDVYGYVNGEAVYSRDEYIYKLRHRGPIEDDNELIDFAKDVTCNWLNAGHHQTFESFYLGDYALSAPQASLTTEEYDRLKKLQKIAREKLDEENKKYDYSNYEGRQMTFEEVKMFLDRRVDKIEHQWGTDNFYTKQAIEYRDKALNDFKSGEVIKVDSYEYNDSYGNGTGSFAKELYSDGTVKTACYGYLD